MTRCENSVVWSLCFPSFLIQNSLLLIFSYFGIFCIFSVNLSEIRGNKIIFPMAFLCWTWKLNITITNISFVEWFFIPYPAVHPNAISVQGRRKEANSSVVFDVFLVALPDLSAFWVYLPCWPVQTQHQSYSKTFPPQTHVMARGVERGRAGYKLNIALPRCL